MAASWFLKMVVKRSGGFLIRASIVSFALLATHALLAQAPPPLKEFSHQKHLKLGNIAPVIAAAIDKGTYLGQNGGQIRPLLNSSNLCEACHRGLETSDKVGRVNMPRMADCLVCHTDIDPPDSCAFCHPSDAQLKPASIHPENILDTHTKKNAIADKQSCTICHGRKFTCLGCHLK